jgi:beta-lactamase class D
MLGLLAFALATPAAPADVVADLSAIYKKHGVARGAFVLLAPDGRLHVYGGALAAERFHPASTFKIANTLVGLETNVLPDDSVTIKWDGKKRRPPWDRDHDLASAFRVSCLPYFQEIARRIGGDRMRRWIDKLDYGNRDMEGAVVDSFWLTGKLAISAREQVAFLRKLWRYELPVTRANADLLRRLMVLEKTQTTTWSGKTGTADGVAWLVGWVERGGEAWFYAALLVGKPEETDRLFKVRRELVRDALVHFKAL